MRPAKSFLISPAVLLLLGVPTAAQDADLQAQVADVQQRYEDAVAARDWDAIASLYTDEVIYSALNGAAFEDPAEIGPFYEQAGLKALDLRSSRTEMVGENLVLDMGTLTATLAGAEGDMVVEGEYVSLAELGEDGLRIRSLTAFPLRQPSGAPA